MGANPTGHAPLGRAESPGGGLGGAGASRPGVDQALKPFLEVGSRVFLRCFLVGQKISVLGEQGVSSFVEILRYSAKKVGVLPSLSRSQTGVIDVVPVLPCESIESSSCEGGPAVAMSYGGRHSDRARACHGSNGGRTQLLGQEGT